MDCTLVRNPATGLLRSGVGHVYQECMYVGMVLTGVSGSPFAIDVSMSATEYLESVLNVSVLLEVGYIAWRISPVITFLFARCLRARVYNHGVSSVKGLDLVSVQRFASLGAWMMSHGSLTWGSPPAAYISATATNFGSMSHQETFVLAERSRVL